MIIIKSNKEIDVMRRGGQILAGILRQVAARVRPGVSTGELEELAESLIKAAGGRPAFKGFKTLLDAKGFPTVLCTSINDEIVHAPALPPRTLVEGDIIGIDVGMQHPGRGGCFTDMAVTVGAGRISPEADALIKATEKSLALAIGQVKPGNTLNDIGRAVEEYIKGQGFSVVRDLVGHGVGRAVHEDPQVPNFVIRDKSLDNVELKPGMTIAIEPMVNLGSHRIDSGDDGFTIKTADGRLSAHFEHTVAVTETGHEVLTRFS